MEPTLPERVFPVKNLRSIARATSLLQVTYNDGVKRLQIMIEEDLEEALERRSAEEGVSKAALIRGFVRNA